MNRRHFLATTALSAAAAASAAEPRQALIAITLDLEMSRNFPRWEDTHWDFEKGNLDAAAKQYSLEAARRVKAAGGVAHFFLVGQVLEQESVDWLLEIVRDGHPIGNHTYDHINITAAKLEAIQHRFHRAPWLIAGKEPADVIRENIALCTSAMKSRLGIEPAGFRTPGGFGKGVAEREDLQRMLAGLGFKWISAKYPGHLLTKPGEEPTQLVYDSIVKAQANAQPFVYPGGLIEVPMSPISDIGAFRSGRWKVEWFLEAIEQSLDWVIENGAVFDFLCHPSCLGIVDPEFRAIDLIIERVRQAGDRAKIVGLEAIAARAGTV